MAEEPKLIDVLRGAATRHQSQRPCYSSLISILSETASKGVTDWFARDICGGNGYNRAIEFLRIQGLRVYLYRGQTMLTTRKRLSFLHKTLPMSFDPMKNTQYEEDGYDVA